MQVGTAVFIVGMSALLLFTIAGVWFARFMRREIDQIEEQGRRIEAEVEERRREIRDGARPSRHRFNLDGHDSKEWRDA